MPIASQQYRKIVKPGYNTLKFHAIDEEHRHWRLSFPDGVQEHVLKIIGLIRHVPLVSVLPPDCRDGAALIGVAQRHVKSPSPHPFPRRAPVR
jgi:hypothetical protein